MINNLELTEGQRARIRGFILHMEEYIRYRGGYTLEEAAEHYQTGHIFEDGVYTRRIHIPAGNFVVGKIHKHEHLNTLESGTVVYMTEEGVEKMTGPKSMMSPAGTKRFLYTLTDVVWTTFHNTDKLTPEEAEEDIIAKDYKEIGMDYVKPMLCIEGGI